MFSVLLVFGTRPEVIKLAPVYKELRSRPERFRTVCCSTGQHRELLDQMLDVFDIRPDLDLRIIEHDQSLFHLITSVLSGMEEILARERPDITIVQGDTSSAFAAALASFYFKVPVAHVEAGLRSHDRLRPFPEEINRTLISHIADLNFCPTHGSAENLANEGIDRSTIFVTGNTVIDALLESVEKLRETGALEEYVNELELPRDRMILVTGHRRESFGKGLQDLSQSLIDLMRLHDDICIVYSVHPNPHVRGPVQAMLKGHERIITISPP
ncbi:MAG: UDP-N-acetylglucosamine 2-epimerase (non-hydrolyzing), partial [Deltaproteobacteria bacterium]|nr:UDP-N-acetylglucosamine 2-epimerase (non-hydrolyzing) [Deltaproteobacteria bacterium]